MSDSEQDKKRNKLGYQRISIACAHCRRRKIRCLLADKDPQGRCQNCIRLKKECIFYPIDQQSVYESRSDQSSRRGVGSASSSGVSSTSPDLRAAPSQGPGQTQYTSLPQQTARPFQGMPLESRHSFQGPYLPVDRPYQETASTQSPWPPPVSHGYEIPTQIRTMSPGHAQHPQHWAYEQSPGSGDFAPFPNETAQQVRTPATNFQAQFATQLSPEQQWQLQQPHPSARSMTYPPPMATMGSNLSQLPPSYAPDFSQHAPPASYAPFAIPLESPQMVRQMQGPPYTTPIPQSQPFSEYGGPYDYQGQHDHQHGAMPVQQGYPMEWDPNPNAVGFAAEEQQHSIPSTTPPQYVVPSQRPR